MNWPAGRSQASKQFAANSEGVILAPELAVVRGDHLRRSKGSNTLSKTCPGMDDVERGGEVKLLRFFFFCTS